MDVVRIAIPVIYFTIMFVISFLQENILVPTIQKYRHCLYRNGKQF
jgi:ACR3 family arsenite efflux pump ArsB